MKKGVAANIEVTEKSIGELLKEAEEKLSAVPVLKKHIIGIDGRRNGLLVQEVNTDSGGRVTVARIVEDKG